MQIRVYNVTTTSTRAGAVWLPSPTELVIPSVTSIARVACGDMHSAIGARGGGGVGCALV